MNENDIECAFLYTIGKMKKRKCDALDKLYCSKGHCPFYQSKIERRERDKMYGRYKDALVKYRKRKKNAKLEK